MKIPFYVVKFGEREKKVQKRQGAEFFISQVVDFLPDLEPELYRQSTKKKIEKRDILTKWRKK